METLKLGIVPSPDLPAVLTGKIIDNLPELLKNHVDEEITWKPEIVIDPLVGTAEYMNKLMDKVIYLKNKNNWDYMVCLTDLPHFMDKHVIMAEINQDEKVALISLPSFGFFPLKQRIKQTICQVVTEMYPREKNDSSSKSKSMTRKAYRQKQKSKGNGPFRAVKRINMLNESEKPHDEFENKNTSKKDQDKGDKQDEKTQEDTEERSDIRYIIQSTLMGWFRILAGMVFANRPWRALFSFKKVLMLAFGTGIYITLFPTPWELSTIYSIPRFLSLMIAAMVAMVIWMVFAHNLWEKPTKKGDVRLRKLYNVTTFSTLSVIVLINYIALFCLFLATLYIFVPASLFEASTNVDGNASFIHYVRLTWLSTSLGTLAGSIGSAGENEDTIREITYSYRQLNRYYEIQDQHHEESKADKNTHNTTSK